MAKAVIDNWDGFTAFLAAQPLCRWSAQKQRELADGKRSGKGSSAGQGVGAKDDNAELAAALASMA